MELLAGLQQFNIDTILILMGTGCSVGLLMGVFGIAGGTVMVPVLLLLLSTLFHVSHDAAIKIAIPTSLACIAVTSVYAFLIQRKSKSFNWTPVRAMIPAICMGVFLGTLVIGAVPGGILKCFFAIYLVFVFVHSVRRDPVTTDNVKTGITKGENWFTGGIVGLLSSLLGIGGGAMLLTPYLVHKGYSYKSAAQSALAVQMSVGLTATLAYAFVVSQPIAHVSGLVGAIHVPLVLALSLMSLLTVKFGINIQRKVSQTFVKRGFELIVLCTAFSILRTALPDFSFEICVEASCWRIE